MTLTISAIQETHAAVPHFTPALDAAALFHALPVQMPVQIAGEGRNPGSVILDSGMLRRLRTARLMSQQDLADECWRRNIRVSIATIKRAEAGHAVRYRVARELARCFDVPVGDILRPLERVASPEPLVA
ncbi:MAG: helix-turn-helix transcriptional regulator [Xanthomonadaceae bacterium]|nr:helix-turn-helix transcriptional regulator [Xanthomonadaceae bacterium]